MLGATASSLGANCPWILLLRFQRWPRQDLVHGGSEFLRNIVSNLKTTWRHMSEDQNLQIVMSFVFGGYSVFVLMTWWYRVPICGVPAKVCECSALLGAPCSNPILKYVCNLYSACLQQFIDRKCDFIVFRNVYFGRVHSFRVSYVK
jgi:hypothetical protein